MIFIGAAPRRLDARGTCSTRGNVAERGQVYDRLATLVPPPARATRDAVLARGSTGARPMVGFPRPREHHMVEALEEKQGGRPPSFRGTRPLLSPD